MKTVTEYNQDLDFIDEEEIDIENLQDTANTEDGTTIDTNEEE